MKTVVLMPWRPGERHRERAFAFALDRWAAFAPVLIGDNEGEFNRAAARNAAAALTNWDVAIFVDADTVVRSWNAVVRGVEIAGHTEGVVLPHDKYVALTATGSALLYRREGGWRHVKRKVENVPLGVAVVHRAAFETLGGFDERFQSWGGEDVAFIAAARTLVEFERIPGTIYHLWHPNDPTKRAYVEAKGGPLRQRYREADGNRALMRALLDER